MKRVLISVILLAAALAAQPAHASPPGAEPGAPFPPPLESYNDAHIESLPEVLRHRVEVEPFNLCATLLFLGAVLHTFVAHRFTRFAHTLEARQAERDAEATARAAIGTPVSRISAAAGLFHFLGEVEAIFGIWVIPLLVVILAMKGPGVAMDYIDHGVNFTEPVFVVAIMAIASTRPVLRLSEQCLGLLAGLGGRSPAAWWLSILTAGPLLGSFITEPAAMTICASLLSRKFFARGPDARLSYATLGLLFVAISAGGTLTHFAAPPVLMVAGKWGWNTPFMIEHFGWKAAAGICISAGLYFLLFRKRLARLGQQPDAGGIEIRELPIPVWVTAAHVGFLALAVYLAHYPMLLIFAFLLFLAFVQITDEFQSSFTLRPAVMVGFFLAGLVVHGSLQQWWIAPVLGRLAEVPLMIAATVLTSFNDNAAITYLTTLVPGLSDSMKYAAVAGAITGGGLTVIANAPNPAGQSILNRHFQNGIGAGGLFLGALVPTLIVLGCYLLFW